MGHLFLVFWSRFFSFFDNLLLGTLTTIIIHWIEMLVVHWLKPVMWQTNIMWYWQKKSDIGLVYVGHYLFTFLRAFLRQRNIRHSICRLYIKRTALKRAFKWRQLIVSSSFSYWDIKLLMFLMNNKSNIRMLRSQYEIYCHFEKSYWTGKLVQYDFSRCR